MTPGVLITFDVECSMGGAWGNPALRPVPPSRAIMGEYDGRSLGLPLICDILEACRLRGTFFLDPFLDEQGYPGEGEKICRYLLDRDQDVQLHVHPNHKHWAQHQAGEPFRKTDDMAALSGTEQEALLVEGAERLARWTGRAPVAFRAGNMTASEETLTHLPAAGLRIDSSYVFTMTGKLHAFAAGEHYNGSRWYGKVLELALSGYYQPNWPGLRPAKPVDLVGISFEECRDAVLRIAEAGADSVVILHSFSLFKVRNVQYDGGRPDRVVIRRFRRFCQWLARRRQSLPARTFAEIDAAVRAGEYEARSAPPPRLGRPVRALVRRSVQAVNRLYWV